MKAIVVMFDSLNRHMLSPYGCKWVKTPNFERLTKQTVIFDNCYAGSLPCMPARRELHTGRYNFLHRSWGSLEPFDDSMPAILSSKGIYTHLVTDHKHYWEDGGATYHTRYDSFEFIRGQEGDPWKGEVAAPAYGDTVTNRRNKAARHDWVNRKYINMDMEFPQSKTFEAGLEFIRTNAATDNWLLQIETFDPHEPFYCPTHFKDLYRHQYNGLPFDWPLYREVVETADEVEHCRYEYAALLSMCDYNLGKILDIMDELNLWNDTMLVVNTDHGYLLGDHGWWGKNVMPLYNEIAHIPLFIWDPRVQAKDERRRSLVQTIDVPATLLDYFNVAIPEDMKGIPLRETIATDQSVHDAVIFGIHGREVNCTDGRYVYMRAPCVPDNQPLYNYTLMPTHMRGYFLPDDLAGVELAEPFSFTKNVKLLKVHVEGKYDYNRYGTMLFDLESDPGQFNPISDSLVEQHMIEIMIHLMQENDAPTEQYVRLGLL